MTLIVCFILKLQNVNLERKKDNYYYKVDMNTTLHLSSMLLLFLEKTAIIFIVNFLTMPLNLTDPYANVENSKEGHDVHQTKI